MQFAKPQGRIELKAVMSTTMEKLTPFDRFGSNRPSTSSKVIGSGLGDVYEHGLFPCLGEKCEDSRSEPQFMGEKKPLEDSFEGIVGQSASIGALRLQIQIIAPTSSTVLITGETGTGKELAARAIHNLSLRCGRPYIRINCAAMPAGLLESELFGHERGAFTGAVGRRIGRFEMAHGGTLFLDEIGDIPLVLQPKLLRVLQEQEFEPLGSNKTMKTDVRVVAATNRDLNAEIADGRFRSDLFYRLNVLPLKVPPLRERPNDVPSLAAFFLQRFAKKFNKPAKRISADMMHRLCVYSWPGNIRELQNIIERAVVLSTGSVLIFTPDFSPAVSMPSSATCTVVAAETPLAPIALAATSTPSSWALKDVERNHIKTVLDRSNWIIQGERGAAKILKLNPSTLRSRMKKLGICKEPPWSATQLRVA
jgi:formate hydrogenlyase transcriptional activator